jgi:N-acetylglutamate synthase-like GNAT family acetyltransferase
MTFKFSEKSFYLNAFRGTTLAVSLAAKTDLTPQALAEFAESLSELSEHGCRIVLFEQKCAATEGVTSILSKLFSHPEELPIVYHRQGEVATLPYRLWQEGAGVVPIEIVSDDLEMFYDEVVRLVIAWRIKRLIITQASGGIYLPEGGLLSYVNSIKLTQVIDIFQQRGSTANQDVLSRIQYLLNRGVGAISLCSLQAVSRELFTYEGCGTFFSQRHYCRVRSLEIDDFPQVATLVKQGEFEGYLLPRSDQEISRILLTGYGAFISVNQVAGVCCLINECYRSDKAGEIVTLYALTRFQGEGIGVQLIDHVVNEARKMGLQTLFSCTTRKRVVDFFERNGFSQVDQSQLPEAKWQGYNRDRRQNLVCLRLEVQ